MDRERATALVEQVLRNLDTHQDTWPLSLVHEVRVFGSYSRGALQPHDVDLDVERNTTPEWRTKTASMHEAGTNPYSLFQARLIGRRRGRYIVYNADRDADFESTTHWRRGDSLDTALGRLHAIRPDPTAGRAPRDAMIPSFGGVDQWLPLWLRESVVEAVRSGAVTVERLTLEDAAVPDPAVDEYLLGRWPPTSPLYRASSAVVAHWTSRGIDPRTTHLHGKDVEGTVTPYFAGFSLRYVRAVPRCLTLHGGLEWLEVVHPTRSMPLHCLSFAPADETALKNMYW